MRNERKRFRILSSQFNWKHLYIICMKTRGCRLFCGRNMIRCDLCLLKMIWMFNAFKILFVYPSSSSHFTSFLFHFFWVRYDSPSQMLIMTRKGAYVYMDDAQIWSHAIYQHLNDFISISVWMRMLFKMWKIIFRFMIVPNEYGERERKKQEKNFIRWWWWWWMKAMKMINERYWWICFNFTKFNCFCLTCYAFEKKYRFVLSTEICSIFFFFSLSVCVCFSKHAHIHIRNKFEKYFVAWIEQKRYKLCRSINSFKFFTHEDTQKATSNLYRKWKQI